MSKLVIVHGPTGSGKSRRLRELREEGYEVFDEVRHPDHLNLILSGELRDGDVAIGLAAGDRDIQIEETKYKPTPSRDAKKEEVIYEFEGGRTLYYVEERVLRRWVRTGAPWTSEIDALYHARKANRGGARRTRVVKVYPNGEEDA